ncbi:MAG TPA: hypothetical protein VJ961_03470 [Mariprofundaceae bacterium]|nr:hypothetical protein [Mariprofundaceae bacterium]
MGEVQTLPGAFPLHQERDFLSESEWVVLKLLCRPVESLAEADAAELSRASGGQLSEPRCEVLIHIVRIASLPGLGSWIARLMAEAGLNEHDIRTLSAEDIMQRVNNHAGYPLCNRATVLALEALQKRWSTTPTNTTQQ